MRTGRQWPRRASNKPGVAAGTFGSPIGSRRSTRENRLGPRGYSFRQFRENFARYVAGHPALDDNILDSSYTPPNNTIQPAHPALNSQKPRKTAKNPAPDEPNSEPGEPARFPSEVGDSRASAPNDGSDNRSPEGRASDFSRGPRRIPKPPNGAPAPGNGAASSPPGKRHNPIEEAIWQCITDHPDWGDARIAKEVGRTASFVAQIRNPVSRS
jgi:hypothetical protein